MHDLVEVPGAAALVGLLPVPLERKGGQHVSNLDEARYHLLVDEASVGEDEKRHVRMLAEDLEDVLFEKRLSAGDDGKIDPHLLHLGEHGIDLLQGKFQRFLVIAGVAAVAGK